MMDYRQHWQYGEDVKEGILESINGFGHIAPVVHGSEEEEGLGHDNFGDGEYGEIEITIKFRGRTGSSTTSRKLRVCITLTQQSLCFIRIISTVFICIYAYSAVGSGVLYAFRHRLTFYDTNL